jgi:O-methyltransferase involved in polyketide biosynthesis
MAGGARRPRYRPRDRSVWLIEGLLYYLAGPDVDRLLGTVRRLTAADSLLGLDVMNRGLFFSPAAWPMQVALAVRGAPGRFGTNEPETLMARHGFDADVTQPGDPDANFGRWPRRLLPRDVPGWPRSFLVRAERS